MTILFIIVAHACLQLHSSILLENPCGIMAPRGYEEDWGIGVYYIPPHFEVDLYSDTLGTKAATIAKQKGNLDLLGLKTRKFDYNFTDIEYVGNYYNILLKVDITNSAKYFKVFWKTYDNGLLVKKADLEKSGAIFYTYKDILFDTTVNLNDRRIFEWSNIGINLSNVCLNLRKQPSTEADIIECLYGNNRSPEYVTHFKILDHVNDWAKVESSTFSDDGSGEDCPYTILKQKTLGWVKAIDKSGFPNIWYSVSSY